MSYRLLKETPFSMENPQTSTPPSSIIDRSQSRSVVWRIHKLFNWYLILSNSLYVSDILYQYTSNSNII